MKESSIDWDQIWKGLKISGLIISFLAIEQKDLERMVKELKKIQSSPTKEPEPKLVYMAELLLNAKKQFNQKWKSNSSNNLLKPK